MFSLMTMTDMRTGNTVAVPFFTAAAIAGTSNERVINVQISNNNQYLAATALVYDENNSDNSYYGAFVRDMTNNRVVRVIGQQPAPNVYSGLNAHPNAVVSLDPTNRFACYTENSQFLAVFPVDNGNFAFSDAPLINVDIPNKYRSFVWVGSAFSPVETKLYVLGYNINESGVVSGDSVILVIDTTTWTTMSTIRIPYLKTTYGGDWASAVERMQFKINHNGTLLYINNIFYAETNCFIYNLTNNQFIATGYPLGTHASFGVQSKVILGQSSSRGRFIQNFPSLTDRPLPDFATGYDDSCIQSGHISLGTYGYTEPLSQFVNSFSIPGFDATQYVYDPVTKLKVCHNFTTVVDLDSSAPIANAATVLQWYQRICTNLGLDGSNIATGMLTDDTCTLRPISVTPFNAMDWSAAAPTTLSVSADTGFGLHLRPLTTVASYVSPLDGTERQALARTSFATTNPPFLILNSKVKNWDMSIVEYREQQNGQYTIAYMKIKEVYGNYVDEIEQAVLIGSNGRIDFVSSQDTNSLTGRYHRMLVLDDSSADKNVLQMFGSKVQPLSNYVPMNWFSNATGLGINPLTLVQ